MIMHDAEKTIGNLIDKQGVSFIASTSMRVPRRVVKIGEEKSLPERKKPEKASFARSGFFV